MTHLTPEQLEAFVTGAPLADEAELRAHVHACPACAKALEREAQLETALHVSGRAIALAAPPEVSSASLPARRRAATFGVWRTVLAAAAMLVVVAGIAWMLRGRAPQAPSGAASAPVAEEAPQPSAAPTPLAAPTPSPAPTPERVLAHAPRAARQAPAQSTAPFVMPASPDGLPGYDVQSPRTFGLNVFAPDSTYLLD